TMTMPPTLRWALARLPLDEEERMRLEREEFEAKGFISNMERLLIAADDSANGKFAARLAGLVAGSNGMPTTIIATHAKGSALTIANGPGRARCTFWCRSPAPRYRAKRRNSASTSPMRPTRRLQRFMFRPAGLQDAPAGCATRCDPSDSTRPFSRMSWKWRIAPIPKSEPP